MQRFALTLSLLGGLGLAACSSSNPAGTTTGTTTGTTSGGSTSAGTGGTSSSGSATSGSTSGSSSGTTGGYTITITSFDFSPDPIVVPAGATITVVNKDSNPHSATSEAAAGDYSNGQVAGGFTFDTGTFTSSATTPMTISVPSGLASGTQQPYYCKQHKSGMVNPNPIIKIQ